MGSKILAKPFTKISGNKFGEKNIVTHYAAFIKTVQKTEKKMKLCHLCFLVVFLLINLGQSQVLKARVDVEFGRLNDDQRQDVAELEYKIDQYFNNFEWVEDEFESDINVSVKVMLETVQQKTFEKLYKAQFLISSESGENFYDKNWEFAYESSSVLSHTKGQFDPLTHVLDFYAYMVLGGELDTYGLLLGSTMYDKALDIANQGLISQYPRGWSQRLDDLQKITHIRTRPLREVKPDFFEALYLYEEGNYAESYKYAKKVMEEGIKKVYDNQPNNRYLRMFFDAHYRELANLFAGQQEDIEALMDMDGKHLSTYRDYLEN